MQQEFQAIDKNRNEQLERRVALIKRRNGSFNQRPIGSIVITTG
jgi:hypothetical protein